MPDRSSLKSWAEQFRELPPEEKASRIARLSEAEAQALLFDWGFWARQDQLLPGNVNPRTADGSWITWLVMAGRGWGKTRVGAETVRQWVKDYPIVNIVAATGGDIHKVILDGPSGLMNICPDHERPRFSHKDSTLYWPNGSKSLIFSAEEPNRLRGPQCYKLWADELGAWRYQEEAWDQAMFGLRLGDNPQVVVTTTPRPTKLVKELAKAETTLLTCGTTYDNRSNLAKNFFDFVIRKYEGTRLGRQELNAELLEDNPGALWNLKAIDADRVKQLPYTLYRVVVGVDPAVTSKEGSDETGIVVAAAGSAPSGQEYPVHFYVFDDLSLIASPDGWAREVVNALRKHKADRIVAEVNNGGDLVESVIRHVDPNVPYRAVHASRGKIVRAEPVSALYEQHRVHHVGSFSTLEDQMCGYNPQTATDSPDRMDALVWAITDLSSGEAEYDETVTMGEEVSISSDLDELDSRLNW